MSSPGTEILLARQLAGLRRHGWSTLDALALAAEGLPGGEAKASCDRTLAALRAGATGAHGKSAFERACAQGEKSTGESFECLAEALEARESAAGALASTVRLVALVLAGPVLLGTALGWAVDLDVAAGWGSLPAPTVLARELFSLLRFVGVPLAAGVVLLAPRVAARFSPGAREFKLAAELLESATLGTSAVEAVRGDLLEAKFFAWRAAAVGPEVAAHELARELVLAARSRVVVFEVAAPVVAAAVGGTLAGGLIVALYLPIFSIAGSVK